MMRQQHGFTLIELMISTAIGLSIMVVVSQIFLSSNQSDRLNQQLGMMQESARTAMKLMSMDVRMAGFTGCDSATPLGNALSTQNAANNWATSEQRVQGLNQNNSTTLIDAQATSESLLIFKLDPENTFTIIGHNANSATLTLDQNTRGLLSAGDAAGISRQDCSQVALVALTSVSGSSLMHGTSGTSKFRNCYTQLRGTFRCYDGTSPARDINFNPGVLRPLKSVAYFIKPDNGIPTLFRKMAGNPTPEPIVDGIEQLRIYYGIDSDDNGSADRYIRAGARHFQHADWRNTSSIRIHLITRSEIEVTPTPRNYFFDGAEVTPTDRYLRKEYVLTLALRN